ncbi:MAG TPA: MFS transporter [Steroidobacteraceae bacterium]|jgi:ACS family tartrate transporter-like MFS transporter
MTRDLSAQLGAKVHRRLGLAGIAFMLVSSLDRVNISFAALGMNSALGLTPSEYGFGAGILFVGFLVGQYPSVLWLQRVGMHRWLTTCTIAWALCAGGTAFVHTPLELYALRLALGFAEGGLAPGIVLYLSQFATERERATVFALPMLAIPVSIVIGSPISGWLLSIRPPLGLASWRWMLLAEAVPALLLGVAAWFYFPDLPEEARWLTAEERTWLSSHAAHRIRSHARNDWRVLCSPLVWASALLWFGLLSGAYGIMFWLPQVIKRLAGVGSLEIGWLNALPWAGAMLGMYYNSVHSDRSGERFWHIAAPAALAALGIVLASAAGAGVAALLSLIIAGTGLGAAQGAFWALPTRMLTQSTLPVAAVAINIAGSSGGFIMPHLVGHVLERTGGFTAPSLLIAGMLLASAMLVLSIRMLPAAMPSGSAS